MTAHRAMIAVIDDDPGVLESLANLLESAGYDVQLFESAEEFLQVRASVRVDCLISDIRMPGIGGLELLRVLQAEAQTLAVIMITARNFFDEMSLINTGARYVFYKPFDGAALLAAISKVLPTGD